MEDRQCCHLHLWNRKLSGPPWSSLHEETWCAHGAYSQAGTTSHLYTLAIVSAPFFCFLLFQWVIDSGATSDWNVGSSPDARGLACLRKHGIDSSHRARQVQLDVPCFLWYLIDVHLYECGLHTQMWLFVCLLPVWLAYSWVWQRDHVAATLFLSHSKHVKRYNKASVFACFFRRL